MLKGPTRSRELEATWRDHLRRQQQSGLTARDFCRAESLKESAFYYWKRELKRRDGQRQSSAPTRKRRNQKRGRQSAPPFLPISVASGLPAAVEITLSENVSIRVSNGCEESLLRMVVGAVSQIGESHGRPVRRGQRR